MPTRLIFKVAIQTQTFHSSSTFDLDHKLAHVEPPHSKTNTLVSPVPALLLCPRSLSAHQYFNATTSRMAPTYSTEALNSLSDVEKQRIVLAYLHHHEPRNVGYYTS